MTPDESTLTDRQLEVLSYIRNRIRMRLQPPTVREIAEFIGVRSTNAAMYHIRLLEKKGFIVIEEKGARGIRLVDGIDCPNCGCRIGQIPKEGQS